MPSLIQPVSRTSEEVTNAITATRDRQRDMQNAYSSYVDQSKPLSYNDFKKSYTPTVISDNNVRDNIIPGYKSQANQIVSNYDQTRQQLSQDKSAADEQKFQRDQANKNSVDGLFSNQPNYTPDPYEQKQLDLIDRLMQSTDQNTRTMAARQQQQYDQQRAAAIQAGNTAGGALSTALNRLGGRYTPGAHGQLMAQNQLLTNQKLASIDDQEANAIDQIRQAQQTNDYQMLGQKLDLLKGIRDSRNQIILQHQKDQQAAQQKLQDSINGIISDAAKNGAPSDVISSIAGSSDIASATQAAGEYLQSGEYAQYANAVKAAGLTPVDPNTYYSHKIYGTAGAPGSNPLSEGNVPFQATIEGAVALNGGPEATQTRLQQQLAGLAESGDYPSLLTQLQGLARKGMGATTANDVTTAQNQIKSLDNMSKVLKEYKAAGGDMGFLKGTEDTIARRIGQLSTDPKFASIATQLTAAFQQYRQNMTGAAFGAKENADYKQVFPSSDKSFELNDAVIDGLKNYYNQNVNNAYETQLGDGYTNLKEYVDKGLTPTGAFLIKNETDAKNKVSQLGAQDPELKSKFMSLLSENPNLSYQQALKIAGFKISDGSDSIPGGSSSKVVGGYDIGSYATDPNHEVKVSMYYDKTKNLTDTKSIDQYIKNVAPDSPVTGAAVMKAAMDTGVTPGMILAIMQQDSTFGTAGKAIRTKNPGNVGNTDSGATQNFPTWEDGVLAVAQNLAKRKVA